MKKIILVACILITLQYGCGNGSEKKTTASAADTTNAAKIAPPPTYRLSKLVFQHELKDNWCWAACGQMCMGYFDVDISQCLQVANYMHRANCCPVVCLTSCQLPDHIGLPQFKKYQFTADSLTTPLQWEDLKYQIGIMQKPVVYAYEYDSAIDHFVVIYGYIEVNDSTRNLRVFDPFKKIEDTTVTMSYEEYVGTPATQFYVSFTNITKQ